MSARREIQPERAVAADLKVILAWLEGEYQDVGWGFWSNRCGIRRSFEEGDLWVIRDDDEAVAFQVGDYGTDIVCVRKDRQRQGFGTALFEFSLARAIKDNVNVLAGDCSPPESLPFWLKMGFEQCGEPGSWGEIPVRRVLNREHDIPTHLPRVEVIVRFFPEAILYDHTVPHLSECRLTGGLRENGLIVLPRRVIGISDDYGKNKDLVVKIVAGSDERCFCKAKHRQAKAVGVRYDCKGESFYIDEVKQP